ncbi:hypothetical protein [Nesterenkonia ebinurensis]|nr:hypothetical protein [Nesterenkonia ebinurensis]
MATAQSQTAVRDVEQQPASADEFIHYDHIGHGSTPAASGEPLGTAEG